MEKAGKLSFYSFLSGAQDWDERFVIGFIFAQNYLCRKKQTTEFMSAKVQKMFYLRCTVDLQWLKHLLNHENMFETQ